MNWLSIKIAYADVGSLVKNIETIIINPLIVLVFAVALVYFLIGVFNFMSNSDNSEEREKGKQHIIWGLVGMFIMIAVFTIMQIIATTIGSSVPIPKQQ